MSAVKNSQTLLCLFFIGCEWLFFCKTMNAQEIIHPSPLPFADSLQLSSLSFTRVLNTYVWSGDFQKEMHGQIWNAEVHQHIRSRLVKSSQIAIQDEYQGFISLNARLSEEWNLQLKNISNVLADNRVIDLGRMAQHQVLAGFEYLPTKSVKGEVSGGYELNSQEEESDHGFAYALGLDAHRVKLDEFDASLQSSWNQSFLGRRTPRTGDAKLILLRDFGGGVSDSLAINYSTQRSEYYTGLSSSFQKSLGVQHNIFSRDADVFEIMNQTKYGLDRNFFLNTSFGLLNRFIERGYRFKDDLNPTSLTDSHIQEMEFFGTVSLLWSPFDWLGADIRLLYTERDERYSVPDAPVPNIEQLRAQANKLENTAQRTMLTTALNANVTQNDSIRLVSSASILRYDTPDPSNTDDRDELLITSGLDILHRFSSHMLLTLTADLTLFHLVYLRQEQSANNNWNRVIRLSPSVEYVPSSWFRTVARAEVLANYTVSDYEQQSASIRSFSFRQAMWSDSTVLRLSERIECNFSGSLRIFERGTLKWDEFKEKPEEYFIEKTLWPEFIWSSVMGLKVGFGFRYFGQDRYKYQNNQRIFTQGIEALGPTVFVEWLGSSTEKITLSGWREVQKNNGATNATISNLSIQVGFIL
ncbi:MAG: hypothetical protein ABSD46_05845 [Bacteroidota bacterium]